MCALSRWMSHNPGFGEVFLIFPDFSRLSHYLFLASWILARAKVGEQQPGEGRRNWLDPLRPRMESWCNFCPMGICTG